MTDSTQPPASAPQPVPPPPAPAYGEPQAPAYPDAAPAYGAPPAAPSYDAAPPYTPAPVYDAPQGAPEYGQPPAPAAYPDPQQYGQPYAAPADYTQQGYQAPPPGYGQQPYGYQAAYDPYAKSRVLAGILGILLGGFGVHRFYLGHVGIGIAQIAVTLVTFGFGAWWGIIEGIMILCRAQAFQNDATGRPLRD